MSFLSESCDICPESMAMVNVIHAKQSPRQIGGHGGGAEATLPPPEIGEIRKETERETDKV